MMFVRIDQRQSPSGTFFVRDDPDGTYGDPRRRRICTQIICPNCIVIDPFVPLTGTFDLARLTPQTGPGGVYAFTDVPDVVMLNGVPLYWLRIQFVCHPPKIADERPDCAHFWPLPNGSA